MSAEPGDARLFDLGYSSYDGSRERPARAIVTLAAFSARRVLGLGRGARHRVLPAITLVIAFLPALVSVAFSVIVEDLPLLFMLAAFFLAGHGPAAGDAPGLLLRIVASGVVTALFYASLSMAVSSFTTRRAAAAVATILGLSVPVSVVRSAIESTGAPNALDLLSFPFVAADLSYRIFGETPGDEAPVEALSTAVVAGGVAAAITAGFLVCWLRYRRLEAFR